MGLIDIALLGILLLTVASVMTWAVVGGLSGAEPDGPGSAFVAGSGVLASILTLIAALRRWRHEVAVAPWLRMTIACHVWLAGAVSGIVIQLYLGHDLTVPSMADILLLAFAAIVVCSFRPVVRLQRNHPRRAGILLDGAIVGLLAVVAVVTPILGDRVAGGDVSAGNRTIVMLWLLSAVLVVPPAIPIALTSARPGTIVHGSGRARVVSHSSASGRRSMPTTCGRTSRPAPVQSPCADRPRSCSSRWRRSSVDGRAGRSPSAGGRTIHWGSG